MATQETGSELQLKTDKGVYSHQPSLTLTFFLERIMCEALDVHVVSASEDDLLPTFALRMTLSLMQRRKKKLASRYNYYKVQNGDWSRQDESDYKQPKCLPKIDQDKRSEARSNGEHQLPWSNQL